MNREKDDRYSDLEAQRRFEATLRAAFNTPHKPQSEMKLGQRKARRVESPGARNRKAQARRPRKQGE